MSDNPYDGLTEKSRRCLRRLADLMLAKETGEVRIVLNDGGVADYMESRRIRMKDIGESDALFDALRDISSGS